MSWEVWTMKSKMSFFDPTLLKKNVGRFAPAWALLTLALFLSMPLPLIRELSRYDNLNFNRESITSCILRMIEKDFRPVGFVFAFFAALLFAVLVFKYLHRTGDAYMMHAFPMTRNCQFLTNALSGLLFWLVPVLLNGLCSLIILEANGISGCGAALWTLLGRWLLAYLFFYGLAVFTMHISGNSVIAVLSYGALNFLCLLLPLALLMLVQLYFKGMDFNPSGDILRLAPIVELLRSEVSELWILWVYAPIGLVLLVLAWVHYRFRQVERAGDAMAFTWARVAFRLVFTLCCALGLGWILAAIFGLFESNRAGYFLPYAILGCFLGWFGSSMMLERTVKVFRKKKLWLGFAAFAGVLTLTVLCLKYDVLGSQRRVPESAQVNSVEIWTQGSYGEKDNDSVTLTQAADIEAVRRFHQTVITQAEGEDNLHYILGDNVRASVHICYHLSDGSTLRRVYQTGFEEAAWLAELYARPDIATAWYEEHLPEEILSGSMERVEYTEFDGYGNPLEALSEGETLCKDPAALRAAILADAEAGRLPVCNWLVEWYANNKPEVQNQPVQYGTNFLSLWIRYRDPDPDVAYNTRHFSIAVTATETLALFGYK